ncbi:MAG: hypothetical protein LBR23_05090 [Spirochaetaceae bacterium]|jgi:hypothetical protein|nr:hypothetical protein [Spirochaetaceae bacterium]
MKKFFSVILVSALGALVVAAPSFSGVFDSKLSLGAGAGDGTPEFLWGLEEYLNLRMKASLGDRVTFNGAFNVAAAGGMYAAALGAVQTPAAQALSRNYSASIELERLYFRINTDRADIEAGLMRLAFGYGLAWSPMDFLNPKNPLVSDARPRAALAASVTAYPTETMKVQAFFAGPQNPFDFDGGGIRLGAMAENHWDALSLQGIYAGEMPREKTASFPGSQYGVHRAGLSVKADLKVTLIGEALYTWNTGVTTGVDGLSASLGGDYSFLDGDVYVLAEYLYSGEHSQTALSAENPAGFTGRHYLFASGAYLFDDYTSLTVGLAANCSDCSFTPIVTFQTDFFQGVTFIAAARAPLDRAASGDQSLRGELGADNSGVKFLADVTVRVKF